MKRVLFVAALAAALCSAASPAFAFGANSDRNLKEATAIQATADSQTLVQGADITLSNVDRGLFRVTWQATAPNGQYACTADDMLRRVQCARFNSPTASAETNEQQVANR